MAELEPNIEEKENQQEGEAAASEEPVAEPESEPVAEPTLEEDYAALKEMNLLRNVMVRLQYGKYPDARIDGILKRRMELDESKFQGPQIVRIIVSILALFLSCTLFFIFVWLAAKGLGFDNFAKTASVIISLFFFSGFGFVIFNSLSVPDEKKLKKAISERMAELENMLPKG